MIRKAFRMSVEPDHQAEYIRRHDPIWADLEKVLLQHGVQTYTAGFRHSSIPIAGQGRVFYTALGHREDVWENPLYRQHVLGGIRWILKR